jgi:hypothetical protein
MPVPSDPSGTPTVQALAAPVMRVPASCSDLASTSTLSEWFEIVTIEDETNPIDSLHAAAVRTTESLDCLWAGRLGDYDFAHSRLELLVRPQADGYSGVAAEHIDDQYTELDTAGDDSVLWCGTWDELWSCGGEMRVGDFWVTSLLQAETSAALSETVAKQRMQSALQRVSAVLRNAEPTGEAWTRPADAFLGSALCDGDRAAAIAVIEDAWAMSEVHVAGGDVVYTDWATFEATDSSACGFWSDGHHLTISVLPGAAWWGDVWDEVSLGSWATDSADFAEVEVPGADRAVVACVSPYCIAYVIAGGSAFEVDMQDMSREDFVAGLVAIPELVGAAGG